MRLLMVSAIIPLTGLASDTGAARADQVCVKCSAPAATYRCELTGADVPSDARRVGFYCASRIARDEQHSTCAVVRREEQCAGQRRSYVFDASAPVPGSLLGDPEGSSTQPEEARKTRNGPPETVEELTRETARRTGESLERAAKETVETTRGIGEHVGDAARATWRCIGSLFDEC